MSRSIHTTRNMIRQLHKEDWADPEKRAEHQNALEQQFRRKRTIKHQIRRERDASRTGEQATAGCSATTASTIPICVRDEGPFVHYPANEHDIRNLMLRLPGGSCDGLSEVELVLGRDHKFGEPLLPSDLVEPDPYVGRSSTELIPGVFVPVASGQYFEKSSIIKLYAAVYSNELSLKGIKEFYLKLLALSTFMHEVAHHQDCRIRVGRGRWRAEEGKKAEAYARTTQFEWLHAFVVPYLEETYPRETREFCDWIEHWGGIRLTLDQLAGDPRKLLLDTRDAINYLIENVEKGLEICQTRFEFADFIHMAGFYSEALYVLDGLLVEEPEDPYCLCLKAHIYTDQERYMEAREIALSLIEMDRTYADAWSVLWSAAEGLENWEEVLEATAQEIELMNLGSKTAAWLLRPRIVAFIHLKRFDEAEAHINRLEQSRFESHQKSAVKHRVALDAARRTVC